MEIGGTFLLLVGSAFTLWERTSQKLVPGDGWTFAWHCRFFFRSVCTKKILLERSFFYLKFDSLFPLRLQKLQPFEAGWVNAPGTGRLISMAVGPGPHFLVSLTTVELENSFWWGKMTQIGSKLSTGIRTSLVPVLQAKNEQILSCCSQNTAHHAFDQISFAFWRGFPLGSSQLDSRQGDLCNSMFGYERPGSFSDLFSWTHQTSLDLCLDVFSLLKDHNFLTDSTLMKSVHSKTANLLACLFVE